MSAQSFAAKHASRALNAGRDAASTVGRKAGEVWKQAPEKVRGVGHWAMEHKGVVAGSTLAIGATAAIAHNSGRHAGMLQAQGIAQQGNGRQ